MSVKVCRKCGHGKALSEFYKSPTGRGGYHAQCKSCITKKQRTYNSTNGREVRRAYGLRKYGLAVREYNAMLARQGGRCAICGTDKPLGKGAFVVDHDHATGRVRGLLCNNCNRGMGVMGDSLTVLTRAVSYLTKTYEPGISSGLL